MVYVAHELKSIEVAAKKNADTPVSSDEVTNSFIVLSCNKQQYLDKGDGNKLNFYC